MAYPQARWHVMSVIQVFLQAVGAFEYGWRALLQQSAEQALGVVHRSRQVPGVDRAVLECRLAAARPFELPGAGAVMQLELLISGAAKQDGHQTAV